MKIINNTSPIKDIIHHSISDYYIAKVDTSIFIFSHYNYTIIQFDEEFDFPEVLIRDTQGEDSDIWEFLLPKYDIDISGGIEFYDDDTIPEITITLK